MEEWKDIDGYEGRYQVSTHGRVRSLEHTICTYKQEYITLPDRILLPSVTHGYETVSLLGRTVHVHRIVAETFVENPDKMGTVRHKDGNKRNNFVDNLEWTDNRTAAGARPVSQYDMEGNFVCTYRSVTEARKLTGIHVDLSRRKEAGGYRWEYSH